MYDASFFMIDNLCLKGHSTTKYNIWWWGVLEGEIIDPWSIHNAVLMVWRTALITDLTFSEISDHLTSVCDVFLCEIGYSRGEM